MRAMKTKNLVGRLLLAAYLRNTNQPRHESA